MAKNGEALLADLGGDAAPQPIVGHGVEKAGCQPCQGLAYAVVAPPKKCSAKARNAPAVLAPVKGVPWPPAKTSGSSRASAATDALAVRQLQLVYHGGPERPWRCNTSPEMELSLIVTTASPVIRTRSLGRKNDT